MFTYKLTATDRTVLNRFCLQIATKIKFSTNCIRQPLTMELLNNAFSEVEEKTHQEITKLQNNVGNYENLHFDEQTLRFFGGKQPPRDGRPL